MEAYSKYSSLTAEVLFSQFTSELLKKIFEESAQNLSFDKPSKNGGIATATLAARTLASRGDFELEALKQIEDVRVVLEIFREIRPFVDSYYFSKAESITDMEHFIKEKYGQRNQALAERAKAMAALKLGSNAGGLDIVPPYFKVKPTEEEMQRLMAMCREANEAKAERARLGEESLRASIDKTVETLLAEDNNEGGNHGQQS